MSIEELGAAADAALAPTERRIEIEKMQQRNDAALQRIAQVHKVAISAGDVTNVRLTVLVETLLGGMDDARRLDYEHAVQTKFTELIAGLEAQATRATLLNGVRLDPRQQPGPPRG